MANSDLHTLLLVSACLLSAMAVGASSARAVRAATVGLWVLIAVTAIVMGREAGLPVAVVCAAVVDRLTRSGTVSAPSSVGYLGVVLAAALGGLVGAHALRAGLYLVPAAQASPSHGGLVALVASVVGVLAARTLSCRG